jgi:hypothetical protein
MSTEPCQSAFVDVSQHYDWIHDIISPSDLNGDFKINMLDFAIFSNKWLTNGCVSDNNYCDGADFNQDGDVNIIDFLMMSENWLN